jgi:hypothetical protein
MILPSPTTKTSYDGNKEPDCDQYKACVHYITNKSKKITPTIKRTHYG